MLHGSAVAKDGKAIGFIGHSGWGKSTLAATLVGRGWRLLTDDLLVVAGLPDADGEEGAEPTVIPGHPMMRLAPEAAERVAEAGRPREQAHGRTHKLRMDWDVAFLDEPVPLAHVFVLDPRGFEAPAAVPLPRHLAALELAHHTRGRRLLISERYRRAHLAQCAGLVRGVPVSALRRRFGLEHMDALCDVVEATVASPP